jgi:nucleoside-diphosphate-sugar epimerase
MAASVPEIIRAMREVAPPGRRELGDRELRELGSLTAALLAARPDAAREILRFDEISRRGVRVPADALGIWLAGKTILVTGGTGCIGSTLLAKIAQFQPARLVSVSRGDNSRWGRLEGAEYRHADVAVQGDVATVFASVRPDLVFHVAAQRDPGLAERMVQRTVSTNVIGTRNVVSACEEFGVAELVSASTGKALRPYSREVYTASKRAAEWLLASAAARGRMTVSASRFTHVVDNSIVAGRLHSWARDGVVRLHDPDTLFYAQSARESAQLMLCAGLRAQRGVLRVSAISNLDWPVSLLDLAIGTLLAAGSASPIYFSGHDPGYESVPFPGLYDPATAGEISPLLSAFEAASATAEPELGIDSFGLRFEPGQVSDAGLAELERACGAEGPEPSRAGLDELSWQLFDAALAALPRPVLSRAAALAQPHTEDMSCDHSRMLAGIRRHAGTAQPEMAGPGVQNR